MRPWHTIMMSSMIAVAVAENAAATSLALTQDGNPAATIVIASNATRAAHFAACELQYHVQKITGAELPIVADAPPTNTVCIFVGESKATVAAGLRNADFEPQEYLIRFRPGAIVLMGRDKDDRRPMDYASAATFPVVFDEQATCYAVYDFLERCCGVRWYLPTDLGLVCPTNPTLSVTGEDIRRAPAVKYRYDTGNAIPGDLCGDTVVVDNPVAALGQREHHLWLRRNRYGGESFTVTHSFYGYNIRFLEKDAGNPSVFEGAHPGWFAQGYRETNPRHCELCFSNPDVIRQVVQDARDYFDGKGLKFGAVAQGDYFAVVPLDNNDWCKCTNCQAQLKKEATRGKGRFSNDRASDYIFGFVNKVAREIAKSHPNKYLATIAYLDYSYPPEKEPLEPNVAVSITQAPRQNFAPSVTENDRAIFSSWADESHSRRKFIWAWYCFPAHKANGEQVRCFPGFCAHTLVKQMNFWIAGGIRGIFVEPSYIKQGQKSVLMDQVESYITWKLADNPTLNGDDLIAEFFRLYYGAAAEPMRAFYEQVEEIYGNPTNYPAKAEHQSPEFAWTRLGNEERMTKLGTLMQKAHAMARTDLEKQRVALFDKGIWQYMLKGRATYLETAKIPIQSASVPRLPTPATTNLAALDWSKAAVLTQWRGINGQEHPDRHEKQMEGRLLHDGTNLYIRLQDLMDPNQLKDRGNIWFSDEYELFFGRQRAPQYNQIGIHFNGDHEGFQWPARKRWDSGIAVVSDRTQKDRWVLYLTLPLDRLILDGVKAGDTFYMNVVRSMGMAESAVAWNATLRGYHAPERFGEITLE